MIGLTDWPMCQFLVQVICNHRKSVFTYLAALRLMWGQVKIHVIASTAAVLRMTLTV